MGFLSLKDQDRKGIDRIIDKALQFKKNPPDTLFSKKIVCPFFFEPSTRTAASFEIACKKLGLEYLHFTPSLSSTVKGESLFDTLKTIESMGVDLGIIRLKEEGLLEEIAPRLKMKLINAGEGTREHPSQALLDAVTIKEHFGTLDGLVVSVIGDIPHSRVASSLSDLLSLYETKFQAYCPEEFGGMNEKTYKECLEESDVVVLLRNQLERHSKQYISADNYNQKYGLNSVRANSMKKGAILMHPGPFNRGVEIGNEILELDKCKIDTQVTNGVFTRMAIICEVLGE